MAHPLEIIAQREAELDLLSRERGLSPAELDAAERLMQRKRTVLSRLPRQIAAAERKAARLRHIYESAKAVAA